ncbi:hypothetical protein I6J48_04220 [Acinetobacter calcoaceticus]|uniref:hypothetical protein n=1 Tax=Acinetobacter calcoaceticus TaxID=471 RepID=UPI0019687DA1|nr:hypothetical protein [Acinetobacter calcoaceticus]QSB54896.1 hypothetical protein I6J48_04220 [Acinetobacter calcoaceticus]
MKKLKDQKEKILKKYSYSSVYKKYFEINTNSKKFPSKRVTLLFFSFFLFFTLSYLISIPKLKDESLYIFAAQVTVVALIFPIILTLVGILYSKKYDFDSVFRIYTATTNSKKLYQSSFIIIVFYVVSFFYVYDSSLTEKIRVALNATLAIFFIDAILISLFFLEKTISFTTTKGFNKNLIQFYINSKEIDESINIFSIITNKINEDMHNSDLNSFEKNLNFLIKFLDIVIITSTEIKDNKISSNLNNNYQNNLFGTKLSKIIFLIQKNIETAINHPDPEFYKNLKDFYFYTVYRNYKILENQSVLELLRAHYRHTFFITTKLTEKKPNIINEFISSWYNWLNSLIILDDNLTFYIYKNHLNLTTLIINTFSKDKNIRGLDFICDCLSRWEDVADKMPNYVEYENKLQTIFECENLNTLANFVLETKLLSFYLISKNLDNNKACYKYYEVLIKGKTLIKTTDLMTNSYSFQNIDEILFSYFRLLSNHLYEHYFNNFLEEVERVIEISGLIHGGWIPFLESRITNYIIKLLLLNSPKSNSISNYFWESALKNSSIAKNDKILNLLLKIKDEITNFNDYGSLEWDIKKLEITKKRLSSYTKNLNQLILKHQNLMFESIRLDNIKTQKLISENTLYIKDLNYLLNNSIFSSFDLEEKIGYREVLQSPIYRKFYPSKYLTSEYNIHLDILFKLDYYTSILDHILLKEINKIKKTEYIINDNPINILKKIYLKSMIFSAPVVIFNHQKTLSLLLNECYKPSSLPYNIQKIKNNSVYKVGKTFFKYVHDLPNEDAFYILPNNIFKSIFLNNITPESLSQVDIIISPENPKESLVEVIFPIEAKLTDKTQAIEIIIKKNY